MFMYGHYGSSLQGLIEYVSHLLDLVFGDDGPAVAHPDAALEVVEVLAVALEELDEEDAQVGVRLGGVDPRVQLQEAHQQQDEGVRGEAAGEDLKKDEVRLEVWYE